MKETNNSTTMVSPPPSSYQFGFRPWPKSVRKPLQPKNQSSNNPTINKISTKVQLPSLQQKHDTSNKENFITLFPGAKIIDIEPFEASLAEELSSMRKRMERLKLDKDKTESLLKERGLMLDMEMKEFRIKGEAQKHLENQVDRLFRLNELRLSCMNNYPIQTFREKEGKKVKHENEEDQEKKLSIDDTKRDTITMRDQNTTMEEQGPDGLSLNH